MVGGGPGYAVLPGEQGLGGVGSVAADFGHYTEDGLGFAFTHPYEACVFSLVVPEDDFEAAAFIAASEFCSCSLAGCCSFVVEFCKVGEAVFVLQGVLVFFPFFLKDFLPVLFQAALIRGFDLKDGEGVCGGGGGVGG